MTSSLFWIVKIATVVILLGIAASVATPKGRLPLALRGLARILGRDRDQSLSGENGPAPVGKRLLAFVLVILALLVTAL